MTSAVGAAAGGPDWRSVGDHSWVGATFMPSWVAWLKLRNRVAASGINHHNFGTHEFFNYIMKEGNTEVNIEASGHMAHAKAGGAISELKNWD